VSLIPFNKPTVAPPSTPQKTSAPVNSQPPPNRPKSILKGIQRCFKCQGFDHLASDCTNQGIVTLAEWKAVEKEENEEEIEGDFGKL